jgi:replication initiation protein RepC
MAYELNISPRTFARAEKALEEAGLITKQTALNGYRGRVHCPATGSATAGLSLAPAISRFFELVAMSEQIANERKELNALKLKIRTLRKQLASIIDISALRWKKPSLMRSPAEAKAHISELENQLNSVDTSGITSQNLSCAYDKNVRPHTESTNESIKICNDCEPVDKQIDVPDTAKIARQIASSDFLMYLAACEEPGSRTSTIKSIMRAVSLYKQELGIQQHLWDRCLECMGPERSILSLLILDRNRFHPTSPVRSVPATLTALISRHSAGTLNLMRSVRGIQQRDRQCV